MNRRLALAVAAPVVALVPAAPAFADVTPPTLTVVGHGQVLAVPDQASIFVSTSRTSASKSSAGTKVAAATRSEIAKITAAGVARSDLTTSQISLNKQVTKNAKTKKSTTTYVASVSLTVTVHDISKLSAVLDAASRGGADHINGPQYSFSNPTTGITGATNAALADARTRADAAAAALGMHVVGIQAVNLDPTPQNFFYGGVQGAVTSGAAAGLSGVPVLPGQSAVTANVEVVFLIST